MTITKLDLHGEIIVICERLGLDHRNVKELHITPTKVTAIVFLLNEQGSKHVLTDTGKAATETRVFEVTT